MTLQATGIRHAIGGKTILDGIDLTAHPGEVTAIVGPNGSGKTTFLRALTGELKCGGTVTINGRPLPSIPVGELAGLRAHGPADGARRALEPTRPREGRAGGEVEPPQPTSRRLPPLPSRPASQGARAVRICPSLDRTKSF